MEKLTKQEQRVLELIIKRPSITAVEIAMELGIKRKQVQEMFIEIYRKLRVNSRDSILKSVSIYKIGD
jgi:DNA-binding CsgD family transcriptional regulator